MISGTRIFHGVVLAAAVMTLLFQSSCSTPTSTGLSPGDEMKYTSWWKFYDRGKARMSNDNFRAAIEDFERCLGIRPGATSPNKTPAWRGRVRTYGMHFYENYFPYREIGICYYLLGDYDEALDFLNQSLDKVSTSRARYYFNKAIREQVKASAPTGPLILTHDTGQLRWTNERDIRIAGESRGDGYIKHLRIADRVLPMEQAARSVAFDQQIPLAAGTNAIEIVAKDLVDQSTSRFIRVIADWIPPSLFIETIRADSDGIVVKGFGRDNQQVHEVFLDDMMLIEDHSEPSIQLPSIRINHTDAGILVLKDRAGNALTVNLHEQLRLSDLNRGKANRYASTGVAMPPGAGPAKEPLVTAGPSIDLKGFPRRQTVYRSFVYIDALIQSEAGIREIRINDAIWQAFDEAATTIAHFKHYADLITATNSFILSVIDHTGRRTDQHLEIIREEPGFLWTGHRLRATVMPAITPERSWNKEHIRLTLQSQLLNHPDGNKPRFSIQETSQELWNEVLLQHRLSLSSLADDRAALKLKLASRPEYLFRPYVYPDRGGESVRCQIIDSRTGAILFADDVYHERNEQKLSDILAGLTSKLERRFPLARGTITQLSKHEAMVEMEQPYALFSGFQFLVIEPNNDLYDSRVRQLENGDAVTFEVTRPESTSCRGKIIRHDRTVSARPGDYVYAR